MTEIVEWEDRFRKLQQTRVRTPGNLTNSRNFKETEELRDLKDLQRQYSEAQKIIVDLQAKLAQVEGQVHGPRSFPQYSMRLMAAFVSVGRSIFIMLRLCTTMSRFGGYYIIVSDL
jgi:hypothetical protein